MCCQWSPGRGKMAYSACRILATLLLSTLLDLNSVTMSHYLLKNKWLGSLSNKDNPKKLWMTKKTKQS